MTCDGGFLSGSRSMSSRSGRRDGISSSVEIEVVEIAVVEIEVVSSTLVVPSLLCRLLAVLRLFLASSCRIDTLDVSNFLLFRRA